MPGEALEVGAATATSKGAERALLGPSQMVAMAVQGVMSSWRLARREAPIRAVCLHAVINSPNQAEPHNIRGQR